MIRCHICHQYSAIIRDEEREIAWISHKAHIDCDYGHSHYRPVTEDELRMSDLIWASRTPPTLENNND
jgi:hypothetical protein